jgi:hypothetical protein
VVVLIVVVVVAWLWQLSWSLLHGHCNCCGCPFAACHAELCGSNKLKKLGNKTSVLRLKMQWPWPGRSLPKAQPLFDHGYSITGLKLVKVVAGLET